MRARIKYIHSRIRRSPYSGLAAFAGKVTGFILGGTLIGMVSAWYMISKGSPLTTVRTGAWNLWTADGDVGADPYTLAHMARSGRLPMTSRNALYFIARQDSSGEDLYAGCDYVISGKPLEADWWSLALYDRKGRIINTAQGSAYVNSSSLLRLADGGYVIMLGKKMRPGNWIGIEGWENFSIMLRLYGIHASKDTKRDNTIEQNLPIIRRLDCR